MVWIEDDGIFRNLGNFDFIKTAIYPVTDEITAISLEFHKNHQEWYEVIYFETVKELESFKKKLMKELNIKLKHTHKKHGKNNPGSET